MMDMNQYGLRLCKSYRFEFKLTLVRWLVSDDDDTGSHQGEAEEGPNAQKLHQCLNVQQQSQKTRQRAEHCHSIDWDLREKIVKQENSFIDVVIALTIKVIILCYRNFIHV